MRFLISILFSVLLGGASMAPGFEQALAAVPARSTCACSAGGCASAPCCACSDAPASAPLPLAPVRTANLTEMQALAPSVALLLAVPAPAVHPTFPLPGSFSPGRLPLYQRDCSYLI